MKISTHRARDVYLRLLQELQQAEDMHPVDIGALVETTANLLRLQHEQEAAMASLMREASESLRNNGPPIDQPKPQPQQPPPEQPEQPEQPKTDKNPFADSFKRG